MKSTDILKRLLLGFFEDRHSSEDTAELFDIINHNDIENELQPWLFIKWEDTSTRSLGYHSQGVLSKIRKNIDLPAVAKREEKEYLNFVFRQKQPAGKGIIISLLKYAAVFIVALLSSFLIFMNSGTDMPEIQDNYTEISTPFGSKSDIILPDGTVVTLNSGTILKYHENFNGENRSVFLDGEAFFSVKHVQNQPFYVETNNDLSIRVTGTEFNVKSFANEQYLETTLISGKIIIEDRTRSKEVAQETEIMPNQLVIFDRESRRLTIKDLSTEHDDLVPMKSIKLNPKRTIAEQNTEILTAWKDDKMIFYNEELSKLAIRLERWYNVDITVQDEELLNLEFSGTFNNETIGQAMEALMLASSLHYKIDENKITISK